MHRINIGLIITGLSPRVRGNRVWRYRRCTSHGSIPARAGEPPTNRPAKRCTRVYPRACGGTDNVLLLETGRAGLSPRVRGNLQSPVAD